LLYKLRSVMEILVNSVKSMHLLGAKIGSQLTAGDVIVLTGDLGAGKTVLTQGIASAFGIENVTSPTFVISRVYKGKPNFIHADAYRLLDLGIESFTDLDFESYLPSSVFVIEWGAAFVTTLTDQYLDIKISQGSTETARKVEITPIGQRWSGFTV
jgi:tRNA threonylcarbamoyladenosine biosynthesis protein TsaE